MNEVNIERTINHQLKGCHIQDRPTRDHRRFTSKQVVSAADVETLRKEVEAKAGRGTQGCRSGRGLERYGPGGSRRKAIKKAPPEP